MHRLSYSNVLSTVALLVALGGTAYAATSLPSNSVGTRQLKDGAITDAKVRRHSLSASAFRAGALRGATRFVVRYYPEPNAPAGSGEPMDRAAVAGCSAGERATGGGFEISDSRASAITSEPEPQSQGANPTGWRVVVHDPTAGGIGWSAYVVCASP